jgi:hypothetical protein
MGRRSILSDVCSPKETILSAEIINLNKFRKVRNNAAKEQASEENKIRFGRTKAEKQADEKARQRAEQQLDQTVLSDKDPSID